MKKYLFLKKPGRSSKFPPIQNLHVARNPQPPQPVVHPVNLRKIMEALAAPSLKTVRHAAINNAFGKIKCFSFCRCYRSVSTLEINTANIFMFFDEGLTGLKDWFKNG